MKLKSEIAKEYLASIAEHRWEDFEKLLSPNVERVDPYGGVLYGKDEYTSYLEKLMPTLQSYEMHVHRYIESGDSVVALVKEVVGFDGKLIFTEEALVIDFDDSTRIAKVAIFLQRSDSDLV